MESSNDIPIEISHLCERFIHSCSWPRSLAAMTFIVFILERDMGKEPSHEHCFPPELLLKLQNTFPNGEKPNNVPQFCQYLWRYIPNKTQRLVLRYSRKSVEVSSSSENFETAEESFSSDDSLPSTWPYEDQHRDLSTNEVSVPEYNSIQHEPYVPIAPEKKVSPQITKKMPRFVILAVVDSSLDWK